MSSRLVNVQKNPESVWDSGKRYMGYLLDAGISLYLLFLIAGMPFYNQEGYAHIGTDKAMFFRNVSVGGAKLLLPVLAVYLLFALTAFFRQKGRQTGEIGKRIRSSFSVTDGFALLYLGSILLSYLCSDYKEQALWGAKGWYMGFLPQLFLVGIYFLVSRLWKPKNWMFLLFLPVSAAVFLLGYLCRFDIYPAEIAFLGSAGVFRSLSISDAGFISTIGNINWYCGYLVSVFFAGYGLLWQLGAGRFGKSRRIYGIVLFLLGVYVLIGFASLVTQGSLSGVAALLAVLFVTFLLSARDRKRMGMFWAEGVLLAEACSLTMLFRLLFPGTFHVPDPVVDLLTYSVLPALIGMASLLFVLLFGFTGDSRTGSEALPKFFRESSQEKCLLWTARGIGILSAAGLLVCVGLIVWNTARPGSLGALSEHPFFTFDGNWGSGRGAAWEAGWQCFLEQNTLHKLVGTGPDCMSAFLYEDGSAALKSAVGEWFGDLVLTNAHNEWLTILVNMGVIGFAGFVGMMGSAMVRFLKQGAGNAAEGQMGDRTVGGNKAVLCACGFCLLAYTVNNLFSFQQSMSTVTIYVILGIGEAYARSIRLL